MFLHDFFSPDHLRYEGVRPINIWAYPLWTADALAGSSAEPITRDFLALPVLILVVPWANVWRTYVRGAVLA